jgi:hypothetical protein
MHPQLDMLHRNLEIKVADLFSFMQECNNFAQYDADICQLYFIGVINVFLPYRKAFEILYSNSGFSSTEYPKKKKNHFNSSSSLKLLKQ